MPHVLLMVFAMEAVKDVYEVRPRKDRRGVDLLLQQNHRDVS